MAKGLILLLASLSYAQTAKFPNAVAGNSDLTDLADRAQTTLSAPLNASATSFTVVTGSKFAADMILTVDNEQVKVCSVVGNTVSVGHSSCPSIDGRGFANTVAASHNTGSLVSNYITAYQFKALREEIKAIESTLGPNLSNLPQSLPPGTQGQFLQLRPNAGNNTTPRFTTLPTLIASDYNWSQNPGGSLTGGGGAQPITLSPCPLGISPTGGTPLYISGGSGSAEVVTPSGGTCTSGATSGTVIISPVNSHSGAWAIQSASGGIQEAVCALPTAGGKVIVSASVTLYASVGKCGKTQPTVNKLAGSAITGSFAVLEQVADANTTEYQTGPLNISANVGTFNNKVTGLAVVPEMHDPFPASYGAGIAVGQPDKTKLDANQFLHGVAVDISTNNVGPTNQNAAVLGFSQSYGGADPFGGDFHGVLPSTATAAPNYVIGIQGTAQLDSNTYVPTTAAYPVLANCASNASPKKPCASAIVVLGDPSNLILTNDSTSMGGEGVVLRPADDLNAGYRAFGIVNHAGTANNWFADKAGDTFSRGYDTFVVGANVASANTITPTGTIFHVTGTAAIATINFPAAMVAAGGCIHMIPDAAFTTVTGSNIALGSTAVVNKTLTMCLDPGTGKAYPSY